MEQKLLKWLEEQGYPLEMRVANSFASHGFSVVQARYFDDPEEGTSREIDLTAAKLRIDPDNLTSVVFVVECKSSTEKPWIIFKPISTNQNYYSRSSFAVSQRAERDFGSFLSSNSQTAPIFSMDPLPGYGVTQAFTSGLDVPYRAVIGAVKAAYSRSIELGEEEYSFVLPVVVFGGRLFECSLKVNSELQIKEIDMGTLHWRSSIGKFTQPKVSIVTASAIDEFVARASVYADELLEWVQTNTKDVERI